MLDLTNFYRQLYHQNNEIENSNKAELLSLDELQNLERNKNNRKEIRGNFSNLIANYAF